MSTLLSTICFQDPTSSAHEHTHDTPHTHDHNSLPGPNHAPLQARVCDCMCEIHSLPCSLPRSLPRSLLHHPLQVLGLPRYGVQPLSLPSRGILMMRLLGVRQGTHRCCSVFLCVACPTARSRTRFCGGEDRLWLEPSTLRCLVCGLGSAHLGPGSHAECAGGSFCGCDHQSRSNRCQPGMSGSP